MARFDPTAADVLAALLKLKRATGGFNWPMPVADRRMERYLREAGLIDKAAGRGRNLFSVSAAGGELLVDVPGSGIRRSLPGGSILRASPASGQEERPMEPDDFHHDLGATVAITRTGQTGTVEGRAEHRHAERNYRVLYVNGVGNPGEGWFGESELTAATA